MPFFVNVHGTEQGRGRSFPIGISQLSRSYAGIPQTTSGSDHYLGEPTVENVPDLYVINAFMAAVHDADQPLTSLEFESGTGDYGEDMSRQVTPEAMDLKTRLCVAQGNRLINYYLFSGGHNPPLDAPAGDGNDRIAFTGERHGFAAPVDPEGGLSEGYPALCSTVRAVRGSEHLLAAMDEEHDDVALGFVPDHYLTEYVHPDAARRRELVRDKEWFRGMGPRDILARALLLGGHSFAALDLSGAPTSAGAELDPAGPALALGTPPFWDARSRSGSPRTYGPADGCCCTAGSRSWTTTAPRARCSPTPSGSPSIRVWRAPPTTSPRCAPPAGRENSPRSGWGTWNACAPRARRAPGPNRSPWTSPTARPSRSTSPWKVAAGRS